MDIIVHYVRFAVNVCRAEKRLENAPNFTFAVFVSFVVKNRRGGRLRPKSLPLFGVAEVYHEGHEEHEGSELSCAVVRIGSMKILFLHGWHSVPGGVKPTFLGNQCHVVMNPHLDDDDFEAAVRVAQAEFDAHKPDVIVGSSRGGAVALSIASGGTPLVLLCPAWKRWGTVKTLKPNSVVLHSRNDDVIPFADSEDLIKNSGLPAETLIEIGNDHRLADQSSLSVLGWACDVLASGERLPWFDDDSRSPQNSSPGNGPNSQADVKYVCDACGEEIVIPIDLTEGSSQTYVEDCPVCCRANTIHVEIRDDGDTKVWAEPEQDY